MSDPEQPRRSVLYLPASNPRALEKAKTLPVDTLVLDLEDAVAPEDKAAARAAACAAVGSGEYGHRELTVRVNAVGTPWHEEDLAAVAAVGPDAVVVPKVESAEQVREVLDALAAAGAPETTTVWPMIETARAVVHATDIAAGSDRVAALVLGTNDLLAQLRAQPVADRSPLLVAMSMVVLAARAVGAVALDGVYNAVRDEEGLRRECEQARDLGFDGKTLIHPTQVGPCNEVFAPGETEVEAAKGVVAAWEGRDGGGVAVHEGQMIEELHVAQARRVLAVERAIRERR
ncbi:HpcH/HpaI aldolase/citrate lyase family protein [Marihabitans asiaticum]|uniref:Citrate lyase subunit beta/citryl-CoA lyase n=1 Tax=Marihabitans asiaticum TaxID=415218 RepID=A0A560WI58_9MICO|nr:CoA ester lyase [Marihabitans asiaticum]TWD17329.1 citrate lyase subunit beta/citryl-CoA lyase [Marihabitans asiaticum]